MFTYRCPGCGKHHLVETPFEQDFETKCLRCGAAISVTPELIHQAQPRLRATAAAPGLKEAVTRSPTTLDAGESEDGDSGATGGNTTETRSEKMSLRDTLDTLEGELGPTGEKPRKRRPETEEKENGSRKKKNASARRGSQPPDEPEEEEEKQDDEPEVKRKPPTPKPTPPRIKKAKVRWQLIAAIAAVVLVVVGAGGYLVFGGKKTPTNTKQEAKKSAPKSKPTVKAPPPKEEKKPEKSIPKQPPAVDYVLSAPRLSAELAAGSKEANAKYANTVVEVTGLFDKIDKKDGLHAPAHPHALFTTEGPTISCDLHGSLSDSRRWNNLVKNQPLTVRGIYAKDGYLQNCWLMPITPPADNKHKGKKMEVVGLVTRVLPITDNNPFPAIELEGETNSNIALRGLFQKTDAEEVRKVKPGILVTLQGVCNGRYTDDYNRSLVRLDNCQLVYTSAPPRGMPRLETGELLRDYEEDLYAYYVPPRGTEERIQQPLTVKQLGKEWLADGNAFDKKYRLRVLTVIGKPAQEPKGQTLLLESGDTDQEFKIRCRFTQRAFEAVDLRSEYRVRGLYLGTESARMLRLENCELDEDLKKNLILTADFLPHTSGESFTFDKAVFVTLTNNKKWENVQREVHYQGPKGLTETAITRMGKLVGQSLFEEGEQERWVAQPKTKKIKPPAPGPFSYRRLSPAFVEIGQPVAGPNGKIDIVWTPALKLYARVGTRWEGDSPHASHTYTLEKFDEYHGRPSALIRETIVQDSDSAHPIEILHVYVKGLGEMEQRQWVHVNSRTKRLLMEMKVVEASGASPRNPAKSKPDADHKTDSKAPAGVKVNPPAPK